MRIIFATANPGKLREASLARIQQLFEFENARPKRLGVGTGDGRRGVRQHDGRDRLRRRDAARVLGDFHGLVEGPAHGETDHAPRDEGEHHREQKRMRGQANAS